MKNKAVIFDLDGTLYDNSSLAFRMVLRDLRHLSLLKAERKSREELSGRYFGDSGLLYRALFERMSVMSGFPVERVENWYFTVFMPDMTHILEKGFQARPWVLPLLADLRSKGIRTAVFSDYDFAQQKLSAIGISPNCFDFVTDAFSEGGFKPCRESFESVAGKLNVNPSEVIVVGDRPEKDGAGAMAAGMFFRKVNGNEFEL